MERTLPPLKEETERFVQELRVSVELMSACSVAQLSERDAALELLQRLYLLSLGFTSVVGEMSRIAWKALHVVEHRKDYWPEEMRHRHDAMYGEVNNYEQLIVKRPRDVDVNFAMALMHHAGLTVDTRTNQEDVNANSWSLEKLFYYDYYLDRALSIRLADTLVKLDKILASRTAALAERQRLLKQVEQELREQRHREAGRCWPLRVWLMVKRLLAAEVNPKEFAEAELERAKEDLATTEIDLRYELDTAYRSEVIGKKTLPEDNYAKVRAQKFYQQFFGCAWRDAQTKDPDVERLVGKATLDDRVLFIARTQQLRRKLALDETYTRESYSQSGS